MSEPDAPLSTAADSRRRVLHPDMASLPSWVKEQYVEYLDWLAAEGPFDEATVSFDERVAFYERILTSRDCNKMWKSLEAQRQATLECLQSTDVNQVEHVLTAAHSTYLWYSTNEALKKKERDKLGDGISNTSRKLSRLLNQLWLGSPEVERGYPTSFGAISHEQVQIVLAGIEAAAEAWVESARVVHKPGAGDSHRRYFMCSMGQWFESVYQDTDPDTGELRKYRFDNVITALANCLFVDEGGGIDQTTVTKVLDAAAAARP